MNFFSPKQEITRKESIGWMVGAIACLLFFYSILCYWQKSKNPKDTTIPNVAQFVEGWHMITGWEKVQLDRKNPNHYEWERTDIRLGADLVATYSRHFGGMILGTIFATFFGIMMAVDRRIESAFEVPLRLFSRIAPTAMLPIYFVLAGTEYKMYALMVAAGIYPTLALAVYLAGKKDVPKHSVYKAYTLGASHLEVIVCVVYRQILPRIIEAVRASAGPAMVFLIAAELLVADVGFGYTLRLDGRLQNFNVVFIYLAILGLTGYFIDWSLLKIRRYLCPWFGQ